MPSVRIRDSAYSPLIDSPVVPASTSNNDHTRTPIPRMLLPRMRTMPSLRNQRSLSSTSPQPSLQPYPQPSPQPSPGLCRQLRPRAGTVSRVHDHCIRSSARYSHTVASADRQNLPLLPHEREIPHGTPSVAAATTGSNLSYRPTSVDSIHASVPNEMHHDDVIEHLDVIDSQVATISSLTNAANTILIPNLSWYSRKPLVELSSIETTPDIEEGVNKETQFDNPLDRHVDSVLRRPSKLRRTMRGVWSFLKTPMGIFAAIYGFLVVFWGAAIVLFLTKMINLHNEYRQGLWVEISSQIVNGLFTITGVGLIPSRVLDTYRIYWIWHYKRRTRKLRAEAGLDKLIDEDDLPDPAIDPNYTHVLTEKEQNHLHRQHCKFKESQTWYRPHGTETHRAFPINIALLICLLSDGNSIFQVMLCGTMWGLNRFNRPAWTTATLITFSFLCGISAGVFTWRGGAKTKRVKEVEKRLRDALDEAGDKEPRDILDGVVPINGEKSPLVSEPVVEEIMIVPPTTPTPSSTRTSSRQ